VRLFDPQQGDSVLALRVLAGVSALEPHQEDGDDQDAEDGEGVEEHKVEEGVVGADDGLQCGAWKETQYGHISRILCNTGPTNFFTNIKYQMLINLCQCRRWDSEKNTNTGKHSSRRKLLQDTFRLYPLKSVTSTGEPSPVRTGRYLTKRGAPQSADIPSAAVHGGSTPGYLPQGPTKLSRPRLSPGPLNHPMASRASGSRPLCHSSHPCAELSQLPGCFPKGKVKPQRGAMSDPADSAHTRRSVLWGGQLRHRAKCSADAQTQARAGQRAIKLTEKAPPSQAFPGMAETLSHSLRGLFILVEPKTPGTPGPCLQEGRHLFSPASCT